MQGAEKPEIYEVSFSEETNSEKRFKFKIPIYQRPFAWGKEEVEILLNDLENICNKNAEQMYYLGNIVVDKNKNEKEEYLEVIDGQQRLTVLYLLWAILGERFTEEPPFELEYEIREEDNIFLKKLSKLKETELKDKDFKVIQDKITQLQKETNAHPNFCEVVGTILRWKNEKDKNGKISSKIKVAFGITFLPKDTDVAKYFEVMNSRGKQLEQHQVLKAKLLHHLKEDKELDYSKIWDYCSDMFVYLEELIYRKIPKSKKEENMEQREKSYSEIRNNFFKFICCDDKNGLKYFKKENKFQEEKKKLSEILKHNNQNKDHQYTSEKGEYQSKTEYRSIINFSTFLLHTLKVFIAMNSELFQNKEIILEKVSLDDKKLIKTFDECFEFKKENANIEEKAKEFIKFLLKMRIFFDYFIFKRNSSKEERAEFKRLKYKDGKVIFEEKKADPLLMLQLLFNFTTPQWKQQEWISCALSWLYKKFENNGNLIQNEEKLRTFYEEYFNFLKILDKILAIERLKDTPEIGKVFDEVIKNIREKNEPENLKVENEKNGNVKSRLNEILNQGTATPHYWFYKLEYLLWKNAEEVFKKEKFGDNSFKENERFKYDKIKENYILTRKSSIEHIHPRNRKEENGWKEKIDWFGNLALISNHLNSVLLDKNFEDKKTRIQEQLNNGTIESLKMLLVYSQYEKDKDWSPEECEKHHNEMIELLTQDLCPKNFSKED